MTARLDALETMLTDRLNIEEDAEGTWLICDLATRMTVLESDALKPPAEPPLTAKIEALESMLADHCAAASKEMGGADALDARIIGGADALDARILSLAGKFLAHLTALEARMLESHKWQFEET